MRIALSLLGVEVFALALGNDAEPDHPDAVYADTAPLSVSSDGTTDPLGFRPPDWPEDRRTR